MDNIQRTTNPSPTQLKGDATMTYLKKPAIFIAALLVLALAAPVPAASPPPRLVLQSTVDQLRGDLPGRYADRLTEGGFRYLMEKGTW
jgi:hypothetical protein